ncbi:alpha-mannosidase, partial [bacterium]|nr:alpha-mannosidase [bacterium]
MAPNAEWRHRIDRWVEHLKELFYVPLGSVGFKGFTTHDQLTPQQALRGPFKPMPPGTRYGAKWEYAWLKATLTLTKEARGERIVLRADTGGESAVWVNGTAAGAQDWMHREITLAVKGVPGKTYDILFETYAGHGPTPCGDGPVPHGQSSVPEPPAAQREVKQSSFGIWNEDVYQAWLDVQTLLELRDNIEQDSLRVAEIDEALRAFTLIADLELPRAELLASIARARARLKPLLHCTNGSTSPLMYCFGHSHIDVAWLWPLAETERKCRRTFATQLALMDEYPEYKFLQSQTHLYWMTMKRYPDLYRRIKQAAARGQWIADGGMWVEPDTNLASGESLIRQFIHGKRFFSEEFGVESEFMWLPDVFGYSGALPQIMQGCGIKYFSTQKIFWNYHGGDTFPYHTFWWEGIDGSTILAHIHNDYNSQASPVHVITRWNDRVQKHGIVSRLFPFGWGDGGGGPTRDHLEFLRRMKNLEGAPRCQITHPVQFFKDEEKRNAALPTYVGELYFQAHRGTYTSQARTKLGNRRNEFNLRDTELWGAAAAALAGQPYPAKKMDGLWKLLLLNQFHDIIPGSSIARVYQEAEAHHAQIAAESAALSAKAKAALVNKDDKALTVFNALSWNRGALVPLPKAFKGAVDAAGAPLPVQNIHGTVFARIDNIPACGWTTVRNGAPVKIANEITATPSLLENAWLRVRLDAKGAITSVVDKVTGREFAAGHCNALCMYKDVPSAFDAWDVDSMYKQQPVPLDAAADISVVAAGPLEGVIRVTRSIAHSTLTQDIVLRADSRRIDFRTVVDWRESHRLLKVNFPVNIHANDAIHEIQFGHLRRPTHASRQFDADRFEVSNHKWTALAEEGCGAAVLNDCKYGVNVEGSSINLTLLRSPLMPDMTADKGVQEFTYALYVWSGALADSGIVR